MPVMPYHHGNLRRALIDAALETIAGEGVGRLNLRDLARRLGVSHAAPTHHFGDRTGLLTAIAVEGYDGLAQATGAAWQDTQSFLEVGVAYVGYATTHPGHFAVMFRPDLVRADDPELVRASAASAALLYGPLEHLGLTPDDIQERRIAATAAWGLVHGIATLWLQGSLRDAPIDDPLALTRAAARYLFEPPTGAPRGSGSPRAPVAPSSGRRRRAGSG
jgi:AcrR family transcriptional regulator